MDGQSAGDPGFVSGKWEELNARSSANSAYTTHSIFARDTANNKKR